MEFNPLNIQNNRPGTKRHSMNSNKKQVVEILINYGFRKMSILDKMRLYRAYFSRHWIQVIAYPIIFMVFLVTLRCIDERTDNRRIIFGSLAEFVILTTMILTLSTLYFCLQARKSFDAVGKLLLIPEWNSKTPPEYIEPPRRQDPYDSERAPRLRVPRDANTRLAFNEALVLKVSNVHDGIHIHEIKIPSNRSISSATSGALPALAKRYEQKDLPVDLFTVAGSLFTSASDPSMPNHSSHKSIESIRPILFRYPPVIPYAFLSLATMVLAYFCFDFFHLS
ncbi:hypothetical protein [Glutamicibacter sp. NPDC087344]|uniref:hypothetical protein n=1 Tax=Glutamicibacter sp. NPDC087344 TaxID=3363994 RepID=UPI003811D2F0